MCWGCVVVPFVGGSIGNTIQDWAIKTIAQENKKDDIEKSFITRVKRVIAKSLIVGAWKQERSLSVKLSAMATTSLLTVTTSMLIKTVFHISFCGTNGFSFGRAAILLVGSTLIGMTYSIGINALLNRYVPVVPSSCCHCPSTTHV